MISPSIRLSRSAVQKVLTTVIVGGFVLVPALTQARSAQAQNAACYEVSDPDGWVNVRDRQTDAVVTRIDNGARFWSAGRTRDGMVMLSAPHDGMVISPKRLKAITSGRGCNSYEVADRDGYVNLRETPNGAKIGTIDSGSVVIVVGRSGDWWRVLTTDGRTGFVSASRLR
jgi:Bacterial SH3 domain